MPPRLSILLPTVTNRAALFAKLHEELLRQAEGKSVEIIVACDAKEISIGKKRQNLLLAATGEYVAQIDDDDWISGDYVDRVLDALESNPDCVSFQIECTFNGGRPKYAITSRKYPRWENDVDGYAYVRGVYQKTPVRRDLALKVGFPDLRYAEDRWYSDRITPLCKTEAVIPQVIYFYRFRSENFAEKYGMNQAAEAGRKKYDHPKIDRNHKRRPFQGLVKDQNKPWDQKRK